jgi:hypothetical protein
MEERRNRGESLGERFPRAAGFNRDVNIARCDRHTLLPERCRGAGGVPCRRQRLIDHIFFNHSLPNHELAQRTIIKLGLHSMRLLVCWKNPIFPADFFSAGILWQTVNPGPFFDTG